MTDAPTIKVGDKIRNNDKRNPDDIQTINVVTPKHVGYHSGFRQCYVSHVRVFTDGKKRSFGWNILTQLPAGDNL